MLLLFAQANFKSLMIAIQLAKISN